MSVYFYWRRHFVRPYVCTIVFCPEVIELHSVTPDRPNNVDNLRRERERERAKEMKTHLKRQTFFSQFSREGGGGRG